MGHGVLVKSIPGAVAKLLARNYPELVEWNGNTKLVIFIPDYYLNKSVKYVEPSRGSELAAFCKELAESYPERKEDFEQHENVFTSGKRMYCGEVPEMNLYNALKQRFEKIDESVAVFHSLDILKFDIDKQDNNVSEKDFIIVNASHGYIIAIEVKKTLGKGDSIEKSLQQLTDAKKDLEAYFSSDMAPGWTFIPLIYCENLEGISTLCTSCQMHIILGTYSKQSNLKQNYTLKVLIFQFS